MPSVIDLSPVDRHSDNGSEGLIPPLAVGCADGTCLCRPHARAREEYRRGGFVGPCRRQRAASQQCLAESLAIASMAVNVLPRRFHSVLIVR